MDWNDIRLAQIIHFICFVGLGKLRDFNIYYYKFGSKIILCLLLSRHVFVMLFCLTYMLSYCVIFVGTKVLYAACKIPVYVVRRN